MRFPVVAVSPIVISLLAAAPADAGSTTTAVARPDLTGATALPLTGPRRAAFEAYIADALFNVPGASVAVVRNGNVVYLTGFGVKEAGSTRPVTPDTLMMIGSITAVVPGRALTATSALP